MAAYARDLRALLRGEIVDVDSAPMRMLHGPGQVPDRPIQVPFIFGTAGPRGEAVARELGEGIFTVTPTGGFEWSSLLTFGTVLEPGESADSAMVLEAAGAGTAILFHRAFDHPLPGRPGLADIEGGETWRAAIEAIPERERHLATHEGHLTFANPIDRCVINGALIRRYRFTAEAAELRDRIAALESKGVTEIAYQPAGAIFHASSGRSPKWRALAHDHKIEATSPRARVAAY